MQVVGGNKAPARERRAPNHASGPYPAALTHDHSPLLGTIEGLVLRRRRPTRTGCGADDPLRSRCRARVDHGPIRADIGEDHVHARERLQLVDIELCFRGVLLARLMLVNDLTIRIRIAQRAEVTALEGLHPVGCGFRHVSSAIDGIVHDHERAAAS